MPIRPEHGLRHPGRRRRHLPVAALLLATLVLLASCTGAQSTPTKYGDTTRRNFQEGCVEVGKEQRLDDPAGVCRCAYAQIVKRIPFKDFKQTYVDLEEDPGPLPDRYVQIVQGCVDQASSPG